MNTADFALQWGSLHVTRYCGMGGGGLEFFDSGLVYGNDAVKLGSLIKFSFCGY